MLNLIHVDLNAECRGCRWRYLCGGGCPVLRLTVLENPGASRTVVNYCRGIYCEYSRKILEILLWRKAEDAAARLEKEHPEAAGPPPCTWLRFAETPLLMRAMSHHQ